MGDADPQPAPANDPLIGEVLANRYQLEHKLGEGATGEVYRAKHVKVGRPFAVKILHERLLDDRKFAERFEREAELAGRLRHPNVIGVVDVGEIRGRRYLVMDFAGGETLAALIAHAPMPASRVIHLTRQLCEGLYHAHEHGLIHRDFKPENVIVERDDHGDEVPRIVDFGIAILRESGESSQAAGRLTTAGLVLGTPHYMAPEQAVGDPIDHRIDLFALGIIVYELLCGQLPFDGSGAEVARANIVLDPPPIHLRVPGLAVDPLLEAFARWLMAKRPQQRPASAKDARELLDRIMLDPEAAAEALGVNRDFLGPSPTAPGGRHAVVSSPEPSADPDAGGALPVEVARPRSEPRVPLRTYDTDLAQPIPWTPEAPAPRPRRGPLLAVVGGAASVSVVVALIAGHARGPRHDVPRATQPPVATDVTTETSTPAPAPPPVAPAQVTPPPVTPEPVPAPIRPRPAPAVRGTTARTPAAATAVPTTLQPAQAPALATAPTTPVPPAVTLEITASALATQYAEVGAAIAALQKAKGEDATRELWARYRRIQLGTAMAQAATQRAETSVFLSKIRRDVLAATR